MNLTLYELRKLSGDIWHTTWMGCHYDYWSIAKDELYLFLENIHENTYRKMFEDYDFEK